MALPPRTHYTLHEVTARWGCNIADIAGWADAGRFRILTGIAVVHCGSETVAGKVVLSPMELLPLFRRCGTGPTEGVMRRIRPVDREDWLLITDPVGGITVAIADMLILAEEVHAFEDENDMVRRVASGPGAATPYDWEGMNVALILRIHDDGLPATQAELVAEMQDWFANRSNGDRIPDGRSIRRRITPVWKALRREDE
ncbi:hypothetical protein H4P12_12435 [Paracoccus sp. 11-3]|uniref:Uncharacterized protein n=1 Tax=Paracoccus amoyensis TaxID=2760093 RepID=A0A926G7X5_9RHOB|nr:MULTISPECIES: hypothetical protein [Paracoccus]MBC9247498.1 hypothetical protein [Paracoccus amoyensis]NHF74869.1 hypothetical protein [Paracoccus xiamenensis]